MVPDRMRGRGQGRGELRPDEPPAAPVQPRPPSHHHQHQPQNPALPIRQPSHHHQHARPTCVTGDRLGVCERDGRAEPRVAGRVVLAVVRDVSEQQRARGRQRERRTHVLVRSGLPLDRACPRRLGRRVKPSRGRRPVRAPSTTSQASLELKDASPPSPRPPSTLPDRQSHTAADRHHHRSMQDNTVNTRRSRPRPCPLRSACAVFFPSCLRPARPRPTTTHRHRQQHSTPPETNRADPVDYPSTPSAVSADRQAASVAHSGCRETSAPRLVHAQQGRRCPPTPESDLMASGNMTITSSTHRTR